ncbi:MAG: hypothetical protein U0136_08160 [Bdellovibrionota bacterium]
MATRLAKEHGWRSIGCDDQIEALLHQQVPELTSSGIRGVADWLGHPYAPGFSLRQDKYFENEQKVMREVLPLVKAAAPDDHLVIDTTGSVIYVDDDVLTELRANSYVVYLRVPPSDEQAMFEQYLREPKPLIWQNVFQPEPGESNDSALRRCYPKLLKQRASRYEALADLTIQATVAERDKLTPQMFIDLLEAK